MLRLKLFGQFDLGGPEGRIALSSSKLTAFLAYVALAGKPVPRDEVATVLWGSHFDEQARQNFRQALARLRKALGPDILISGEHAVELAPGAAECDVLSFEGLVRSGTPADLRTAAGLLDGEFLAGIDVKEPVWEDWLGEQRRRLDKLACDTLVRLGAIDLDEGRAPAALQHAEACIRRDFYREDAHRLAILALAGLGRSAEALRHYQSLAERLKRELDTRPEAATTLVLDRVRPRAAAEAPAPAAAPNRKPSIAVLPFANLSTDPEQEYFADGVVDEIITALSRMHWLFVIARNSSFSYKGRAVDVRLVGRELGVRYVLGGSVRKAGGRVRIAGQLIDAETGATLWADRFEGEIKDLFDLQDQVTGHTVAAIAPRLEEAEIARSKHKPTGSLDAYDCYLRGLAALYQWTRPGSDEALHYFKRAIALDADFASAYGLAARCYTQRKASNWMTDQAAEEADAVRMAERAVELGRDDAVALGTAGFALAYIASRFSDGDALTERALRLNPNFAWGWFFSGFIKAVSGEPDAAIERSTRALQLSPQDPLSYSMELSIATAHFIAGRYAEALQQTETVSRMQPDRFTTLALMAACSAHLGLPDKAGAVMQRLRVLEPDLRLGNLRQRFPIKREADFARWSEGLRMAGLPE